MEYVQELGVGFISIGEKDLASESTVLGILQQRFLTPDAKAIRVDFPADIGLGCMVGKVEIRNHVHIIPGVIASAIIGPLSLEREDSGPEGSVSPDKFLEGRAVGPILKGT